MSEFEPRRAIASFAGDQASRERAASKGADAASRAMEEDELSDEALDGVSGGSRPIAIGHGIIIVGG